MWTCWRRTSLTAAATDDGAPPAAGAATHGLTRQDDDTRVGGAGAGYACDTAETPEKYAMTKKSIRAVRKQARASCWAIRLGRLLEGIIVDTNNHDVSALAWMSTRSASSAPQSPSHTHVFYGHNIEC